MRSLLVWLLLCGSLFAQPKAAPKAQPKAAPKAQPVAPPETILIESPRGNVTYTHKQHIDRVKGNCAVCHPSVFPMQRADLNYKKATHRAAEASRTSCAFCHAVGGSQIAGKAFAADSYCTKCHVIDHKRR